MRATEPELSGLSLSLRRAERIDASALQRVDEAEAQRLAIRTGGESM